jgi:hypothetical protein
MKEVNNIKENKIFIMINFILKIIYINNKLNVSIYKYIYIIDKLLYLI